MKLLEICEPLFQYACRLTRSGRSGCMLEMNQVNNDIHRMLNDMKAKAASQGLELQYEKIELPLIFFVDFMIHDAKLNISSEWFGLGVERDEFAGDEKFFDLLDAELADPGDDATERLAIYYTCIGLGFTGIYTGQTDSIKRLMMKISARISHMINDDEKAIICPQAYENVDTRDFIQPPGTKLVGIGIVLVGLMIVWLISYFTLFSITAGEVGDSVKDILKHKDHAVKDDSTSNPKTSD
jgi:type VI secretion system protein ImpK